MAKPSGKLPHDKTVLAFALLAGLPAVVVALALLWTRTQNYALQWALSLLVVACWLGFAAMTRNRVERPLQTMANLLRAARR